MNELPDRSLPDASHPVRLDFSCKASYTYYPHHTLATGLAMLGDAVTAEQAEAWGLIWRCVDEESLTEESDKLCTRFASQPTRGLAIIRKALNASWSNSLDKQLDFERDSQREAGRTDDYREGVSAFTGS